MKKQDDQKSTTSTGSACSDATKLKRNKVSISLKNKTRTDYATTSIKNGRMNNNNNYNTSSNLGTNTKKWKQQQQQHVLTNPHSGMNTMWNSMYSAVLSTQNKINSDLSRYRKTNCSGGGGSTKKMMHHSKTHNNNPFPGNSNDNNDSTDVSSTEILYVENVEIVWKDPVILKSDKTFVNSFMEEEGMDQQEEQQQHSDKTCCNHLMNDTHTNQVCSNNDDDDNHKKSTGNMFEDRYSRYLQLSRNRSTSSTSQEDHDDDMESHLYMNSSLNCTRKKKKNMNNRNNDQHTMDNETAAATAMNNSLPTTPHYDTIKTIKDNTSLVQNTPLKMKRQQQHGFSATTSVSSLSLSSPLPPLVSLDRLEGHDHAYMMEGCNEYLETIRTRCSNSCTSRSVGTVYYYIKTYPMIQLTVSSMVSLGLLYLINPILFYFVVYGFSGFVLNQMYIILSHWYKYHTSVPSNIVAYKVFCYCCKLVQKKCKECILDGSYFHQVVASIVVRDVFYLGLQDHTTNRSYFFTILRYQLSVMNARMIYQLDQKIAHYAFHIHKHNNSNNHDNSNHTSIK